MGLSFSQQISKDITNGYMEVVNQLTAKATSNLNQNTATVNRLFLSVCERKSCGTPCTAGNISSGQGNQVTLQLSVQTLQDVVNNVKNQLEDTTTQYVKSLNQNEQAWLSFAFSINVQDQTTISNFSQKISNLISDDVTTLCSSQLILENNATLILCNVGDVNFGQRNDVLAAVSCVSKQIVNNILSNTEIYNGMQYADQQNYFEPSGPFSFLYYIGLFILFIIIVVTIAGLIRYATRGPKVRPVPAPAPVPVPTTLPTVSPIS